MTGWPKCHLEAGNLKSVLIPRYWILVWNQRSFTCCSLGNFNPGARFSIREALKLCAEFLPDLHIN